MSSLPTTATARAVTILLGAMVAVSVSAAAQGHGGGPGGGGPGGGAGMGGGRSSFGDRSLSDARNFPPSGGHPHGSDSGDSTMRGGLQLGPPGRWWDDKQFAGTIGLDVSQQRRMDDVFAASKGTLLQLYKNLQHEESQLGRLTRARELNEAQIFDQIDRVVQARGELEKASAHYLLQIRKEMTPEQAARLDDHR